MDRRPIKTRGAKWVQLSAAKLARMGVTPNQISIMSMVFAFLAAIAYHQSQQNKIFLLVAAGCIQLRLICNLLDGMVAVEHNKSSPSGELYNDVPDRFADVFIILGTAFTFAHPETYIIVPKDLAWSASVVAVITAYSRVLGRSLGTPSHFIGPMAKQHRMFLITIATIAEFFLFEASQAGIALYTALIIINIGGLFTVYRRLNIISRELWEMKK